MKPVSNKINRSEYFDSESLENKVWKILKYADNLLFKKDTHGRVRDRFWMLFNRPGDRLFIGINYGI